MIALQPANPSQSDRGKLSPASSTGIGVPASAGFIPDDASSATGAAGSVSTIPGV